MLILAIDTTTSVCSVALANDEKLLAEISTDLDRTHSQRLLPMVETLFAETGRKPEDLDLLAVTRGPGSFTGLRIGIATIKGMGLALDLPVVGVSTLQVLVHNFGSGLVCPVLNARLNQVYAALYRSGKGSVPECLIPEQAISVRDLMNKLECYEEPIWFCGDGVDLVFPIAAGMLSAPRRAPLHLLGNRAAALADLARQHESCSADALKPHYLRDSQAEIQLRQRLEGAK
jgi:tRNA threonylcarbamoyladenosine biosynthesis protein TsaB